MRLSTGLRTFMTASLATLFVVGCGGADSQPAPTEPGGNEVAGDGERTCALSTGLPDSPYLLEATVRGAQSLPGTKGSPMPDDSVAFGANVTLKECLPLRGGSLELLVRLPPELMKALEGSGPGAGILLSNRRASALLEASRPLEAGDSAFSFSIAEIADSEQLYQLAFGLTTERAPLGAFPDDFPVHIAIAEASCVRALEDAWQSAGSLVPIGDAAGACGEPLRRL